MKSTILKALPLIITLLLAVTACSNKNDSNIIEIESPAFILFYTDN
jgi:hypothetical protein